MRPFSRKILMCAHYASHAAKTFKFMAELQLNANSPLSTWTYDTNQIVKYILKAIKRK